MELGSSLKNGSLLGDFLDIKSDFLIDVDNKSITHRPDLWGVYGQAREFAAIYKQKLKNPYGKAWQESLEKTFGDAKSPISIEVNKESSCRVFLGLSIDGIKVTSSPKWLCSRLETQGLRPINNIVDISNFVMLELGIPLHIYDREQITENKIIIKRATQDEEFITLDEQTRVLKNTDTVICDAKRPLVLAGVMGGANSGVRDTTSKIFIEVANWQAQEVRTTSTRLGLRTDSSSRYEKSLDDHSCYRTLLRTLELIKEVCPNSKVNGSPLVFKREGNNGGEIEISVDLKYINRILGTTLTFNEVESVFKSLEFQVNSKDKNEMNVLVPSFRTSKDIAGKHDLVEEIGRVVGFDNIPIAAPSIELRPIALSSFKSLERKLQDFMVLHARSTEVMTYPLIGKELLEKCLWQDLNESLKLINSLSENADRMRPSLIPSLIEASAINTKNFSSFNLFEWGRTYHQKADKKIERNVLGCVYYDKEQSPYVKALNNSERLLAYLGLNYRTVSDDQLKGENELLPSHWSGKHPYEVQHYLVRGKVCGAVVSIHPSLLKKFKIKGNLAIAIFDFTDLLGSEFEKKNSYSPLSKFPISTFDCSVVVENYFYVGEIIEQLKGLKIKDLLETKVLSVYRLNEQEKSVTLQFSFGDKTQTLSSDVIKKYEQMCVEFLVKKGFFLKS
jgi:phenylalanyl-tRNA synthetase beta chain